VAFGSAFGILVAYGALDHPTRLGYEIVYFAKDSLGAEPARVVPALDVVKIARRSASGVAKECAKKVSRRALL
jgi:hypothetical protein